MNGWASVLAHWNTGLAGWASGGGTNGLTNGQMDTENLLILQDFSPIGTAAKTARQFKPVNSIK